MSRNLSTLLLLSLLLCSCIKEQKVKKELIGSWRYDLVSMKKENFKDQTDPAQRSYMETMMQALSLAQLDLFDDGSAVFQLDDTLQKGNWHVQNNGKELVMDLVEGPQVSRIQRIAQDTIYLHSVSDPGPQFTRILVPAN
ncbi:MAG TPA: hypothetical protein PLC89_17470 [Haliscomenobacter sp.]|uniref:hypothetical protein n=1 Tax=Haliscomenobacter sp. TaxID=2717303 RepID=UPI002BE57064|nr:hypothetical protein [Haliscomenobacter sp.]HOY19100.1 hypothetical protein [Haliscomenobacter sp.]HPH22226.1 hypothetical protein [Haliscomenobacter sp.]